MTEKIENKDKAYLENLRKIRGYAILAKGDTPKMVNEETFLVPSQSNPENKYKIVHHDMWECSCPDFQKRHLKCKHIRAVELWLRLRENLEDKNILGLEEDLIANQVRCPCGSFNVIKHGRRKTEQGYKQRYLCKDCEKTFVADPIKGCKANGKLIALTMDLYFKGLSTRKIADTIYQFYEIKLHHETIRRWINTFMGKIREHTDKLEPNVGEIWHSDEQKIKIGGEWHYSWNMLDADTRFLISNAIMKERSGFETKAVLRKAKRKAHGINPRAVITDGMISYPSEIKDVFGDDVIHVGNVGIRDLINNNILERYHGTYRERDKVMRGLDNVDTAREMNENRRTYYNFARTHSVIGKTPAEEAGINLNLGRNRWMGLIEKSMQK